MLSNTVSRAKRPLCYVSIDSILEGVGASQILAYMKQLAPRYNIHLITMEKKEIDPQFALEISSLGINWTPLKFGRYGIIGGVLRFVRLFIEIDKNSLVHARSDIPALAAALKNCKNFIWDCRAMMADQRLALSTRKTNWIEYKILRLVERIIAAKSSSIITITKSVIPVYVERYNISPDKFTMITTCVDTDMFRKTPQYFSNQLNILIPGTISPAYDIELMNLIIGEFRLRREVSVTVALGSGYTDLWELIDYDTVVKKSFAEMPSLIAESNLGMSIWRESLGISLKSVASTKTAEFLSVGRPVFVNFSQGDLGSLLLNSKVGVSVLARDPESIRKYVDQMTMILEDEFSVDSCRKLATDLFSLADGLKVLESLYESLP